MKVQGFTVHSRHLINKMHLKWVLQHLIILIQTPLHNDGKIEKYL